MTTWAICSADSPASEPRSCSRRWLDVLAGLPDLQVLADADDRGQFVLERGGGLGGHQSVVLVVVGAPLGVPDDDERAAQLGQEGAADVAGVGAGIVLRQVLSAVGQPQLVAVDQGLHAAQVGERRDDRDVNLVEVLVRQRECDLLHQRDGLEVVEVHLPVAGDQRLAAHVSSLVDSGCSRPRCRAASCPQGIPATRRRRWRCARSRPRAGRARAPRPRSRRRRPR